MTLGGVGLGSHLQAGKLLLGTSSIPLRYHKDFDTLSEALDAGTATDCGQLVEGDKGEYSRTFTDNSG